MKRSFTVQWMHADEEAKLGLATVVPCYRGQWSRESYASDAIEDLQLQSPKSFKKPLWILTNGAKIYFREATEALAYLRPLSEFEEPAWRDLGKSLIDTAAAAAWVDVARSLCCAEGHAIQKRRDGTKFWFPKDRTCDACCATINSRAVRWRCRFRCDYDVCDRCHQLAVWRVTQTETQSPVVKFQYNRRDSEVSFRMESTLETCCSGTSCSSRISALRRCPSESSTSDVAIESDAPACSGDEAEPISKVEPCPSKHLVVPRGAVAARVKDIETGRFQRKLCVIDVGNFTENETVLGEADSPCNGKVRQTGCFQRKLGVVDVDDIYTHGKENVCGDVASHGNGKARRTCTSTSRRSIEESGQSGGDVDHKAEVEPVTQEGVESSTKDAEKCQSPSTPKAAGKGAPPPCPKGAGKCPSPTTSKEAGKGAPSPPQKGAGKGPPPPAKGAGKGPSPPVPEGLGKGSGKGPVAKGDSKGQGKGQGKSSVVPTKPSLEPSRDMKTLPWTRLVLGGQIPAGSTIWDRVQAVYDSERHVDLIPAIELEERFSKMSAKEKQQAGAATQNRCTSKPSAKKERARLVGIDQNQRLQLEVIARTLPHQIHNGEQAVEAIKELDAVALPLETAQGLLQLALQAQEHEAQLRAFRAAGEKDAQERFVAHREAGANAEELPEPFQWEPLEQYMEQLTLLPACASRLSCWIFLRELPERINPLREQLHRFELMVRSIRTSEELPTLLGLVLAFGNYLNGGKNQKRLGQADGFHIELLGRPGGLDVVNDMAGKNLKQLIFKVYFERFPEKAERLLHELAPLFALIQRRLINDGGRVVKDVLVQIEDIDRMVISLEKDLTSRRRELDEAINVIKQSSARSDDEAVDEEDMFTSTAPEEFERLRGEIDELTKWKDNVQKEFLELLDVFSARTYKGDPVVVDGQMKDGNPKEQMTSLVWCRIWDDFFVVSGLMTNKPLRMQKDVIIPRFCSDNPLTVESLQILWQLREPTPLRSSRCRRANTIGDIARKTEAKNRRTSF